MTYKVLLRPEAEVDLTQAYHWYERQSKGLGAALLLSVDAILAEIQRNPELYPKKYKSVRRALLRRFPYGVFYIVKRETIAVLAIFHARRNPDELRGRK